MRTEKEIIDLIEKTKMDLENFSIDNYNDYQYAYNLKIELEERLATLIWILHKGQ